MGKQFVEEFSKYDYDRKGNLYVLDCKLWIDNSTGYMSYTVQRSKHIPEMSRRDTLMDMPQGTGVILRWLGRKVEEAYRKGKKLNRIGLVKIVFDELPIEQYSHAFRAFMNELQTARGLAHPLSSFRGYCHDCIVDLYLDDPEIQL